VLLAYESWPYSPFFPCPTLHLQFPSVSLHESIAAFPFIPSVELFLPLSLLLVLSQPLLRIQHETFRPRRSRTMALSNSFVP
jgi:hypothetical protein